MLKEAEAPRKKQEEKDLFPDQDLHQDRVDVHQVILLLEIVEDIVLGMYYFKAINCYIRSRSPVRSRYRSPPRYSGGRGGGSYGYTKRYDPKRDNPDP